MKRGRHAADDGSFGRSAGVAAGRGAALIAVALVVGYVLLQQTDDEPTVTTVATDTSTTVRRVIPTVAPTTTAPLRAPRDIRVLVVNGTKVSGAGGRVTTPLKTRGYNVLSPVDATAGIKAENRQSAVYYTSREYEREARELQRALELPEKPVELLPTNPPLTAGELRGANVVILVGAELTTPKAGATTTTAARTATTRARVATTTTTARTATTTSTTAP